MRKGNDRRKTRNITSKDDWRCPVHGINVTHRHRMKLNEKTGKREYAGEYFSCEHYSDCGYYVTFDGKVPILEETKDGNKS